RFAPWKPRAERFEDLRRVSRRAAPPLALPEPKQAIGEPAMIDVGRNDRRELDLRLGVPTEEIEHLAAPEDRVDAARERGRVLDGEIQEGERSLELFRFDRGERLAVVRARGAPLARSGGRGHGRRLEGLFSNEDPGPESAVGRLAVELERDPRPTRRVVARRGREGVRLDVLVAHRLVPLD